MKLIMLSKFSLWSILYLLLSFKSTFLRVEPVTDFQAHLILIFTEQSPWGSGSLRLHFFFFYFFICGGFCHTLKWNSQGFTCVPHPNPPSHLPLHPFPLGFPSAPDPSTCWDYILKGFCKCFICTLRFENHCSSIGQPIHIRRHILESDPCLVETLVMLKLLFNAKRLACTKLFKDSSPRKITFR